MVVNGDEGRSRPFAKTLASLSELGDSLARRSGSTHIYAVPSQADVRQAQTKMMEWNTAGNIGLPPSLTKADLRAAIYDFGRCSAQIQAYRHVLVITLREHVNLTIQMLETGRLVLGLSAIRGIIERVGFLSENIHILSNKLSSDIETFSQVIEAGDIIGRMIYSTRVNWKIMSEKSLSEIKKSEIAYIADNNSANMEAKCVLNGIDQLGKAVKGARNAYNIICEFVHPNVGDIISATVEANAYRDAYGIRHINRIIGIGSSNIDQQGDVMIVINSTLEIVENIFAFVPELFSDLDNFVETISKITRISQHGLIKNNRDIFSKGDPCPCLSGKDIRRCAPMSLKK